jgi:hypothetical protein
VIGAKETAFARFAVWFYDPALTFHVGGKHLVERRVAETNVFDIAGFAPWIDDVNVDVGESLIERVKRMLGVLFCA